MASGRPSVCIFHLLTASHRYYVELYCITYHKICQLVIVFYVIYSRSPVPCRKSVRSMPILQHDANRWRPSNGIRRLNARGLPGNAAETPESLFWSPLS